MSPVPPMLYNYKFNGMELQDEMGLNLYDMPFRDYDPAIGRWTGMDPVIDYTASPYNGYDNNPVFWADPSGADVVYNDNGVTATGADISSMMSAIGNVLDGSDPDFQLMGNMGFSEKDISLYMQGGIGTNDWLGDGGSVKYNGSAYFGTNYIGPGPDIDPYSLRDNGNLLPLDMLDQAAFEHDVAYYNANTGGVKGALKELSVTYADKKLAREALHIIREYRRGGIDPVTGEKISVRTRNAAKLVYMAFKPIEIKKSSSQNVNVIINHFFNYINSSISRYH